MALHGLRWWGRASLPRGSYPERGRKTVVLLDAAKLLGKLHFSLWRRCHNSFPPKSCTISTSRSVRRPFSTACSCAVIPRTSCGETSKCPRWSLPNGTARQNATPSFVTFLRAWWITAVTSWPSSISWWVRTATLSAFNSLPIFRASVKDSGSGYVLGLALLAAVLPCTFGQVKKCQATQLAFP